MSSKSQLPLIKLIKAFSNAVKMLSIKFPSFIIIIIIIVFAFIFAIIYSQESFLVVITAIITIICLGNYIINDKWLETSLTFILGIFMIFSINWNRNYSIIFICSYFVFNVLSFIISSIKIASKVEDLLTNAASFVDSSNIDSIRNNLNEISSSSTKLNQLSNLDKAEAIRYFCIRKLPLKDMEKSLEAVETLNVALKLELIEACKIIFSFFQISKYCNDATISSQLLELLNELPFDPTETCRIIGETKSLLISNKMNNSAYVLMIKNDANKGYSAEDIISKMKRFRAELNL